jgi:hypothetical protein
MAIISLPAMSVTISVEDITGSPSSMQLHVAADVTLADIETRVASLNTALAAATDCRVLGYSVSKMFVDTAPPVAAAGGRVERRGVFGIRTDLGKVARISVPGIKAALVSPTGGLLSTDAAIAALRAELTGGDWTDSNGGVLTTVLYDEEKFSGTTTRQKTSDTSPAA